MEDWRNFNIKTEAASYTGKRIEIEEILNKEIIVSAFRIEPSKYPKKEGDQCLHMQIKIDETDHVIFTIAKTLMKQIVLAPKLPFKVRITKQSRRYEFS